VKKSYNWNFTAAGARLELRLCHVYSATTRRTDNDACKLSTEDRPHCRLGRG